MKFLCGYHVRLKLQTIQSFSPGGAALLDCFASFSNLVAVTTRAGLTIVPIVPWHGAPAIRGPPELTEFSFAQMTSIKLQLN